LTSIYKKSQLAAQEQSLLLSHLAFSPPQKKKPPQKTHAVQIPE